MTWGYWTYPYNPLVSRSKWLEPRSMVHISARWTHAKTDNFQSAFLNGVGFESWENVWGIWNGITPRDGEALRRFATIERGVAPFLVSADWQPYYPTLSRGLFSSRFPLNGDSVWTLVNRSDFEMDGPQLRIHGALPGAHFYDLYHGVYLTASHGSRRRDSQLQRGGKRIWGRSHDLPASKLRCTAAYGQDASDDAKALGQL